MLRATRRVAPRWGSRRRPPRPAVGAAFDVNQTFRKGPNVLSGEGGIGYQNNLEEHKRQSHLDLYYFGLRYSLLPLDPVGPSVLRGSLEVGLEPTYVKYSHPEAF